MSKTTADVLVVGGGPAGMMAGMLLARAGVDVLVLEKHKDFFRDFRGDTVHPSTMQALHELGMLERFLKRPHDRVETVELRIAGGEYQLGDFSHLPVTAPYIAMMPQWDFLDFIRDEATAFPCFELQMEAQAAGFVERDGRIVGVHLADGRELFARKLVLATDGRSSLVRGQHMLPVTRFGVPMDVLWFRLPKPGNPGGKLRGSIDTGRMVVLIDRQDYWQTAYLVPKGCAHEVEARGVDWVVDQVRAAFPGLTFEGEGMPASTDDLHLLSVALDRLDRWHRPGLLAIGDAAHAMSPIGGVGINLAVQDAIATANILAAPLAQGGEVDGLLHRVQQRRRLPTWIIQTGQKLIQDNLIGAIFGGAPITRAPWIARLLNAVPLLQRIPGRLVGLGFRPEHVRSPAAKPSPL